MNRRFSFRKTGKQNFLLDQTWLLCALAITILDVHSIFLQNSLLFWLAGAPELCLSQPHVSQCQSSGGSCVFYKANRSRSSRKSPWKYREISIKLLILKLEVVFACKEALLIPLRFNMTNSCTNSVSVWGQIKPAWFPYQNVLWILSSCIKPYARLKPWTLRGLIHSHGTRIWSKRAVFSLY